MKTVDRFLLRELAMTLGATMLVLLAIVLSSRLATYLTQVANGLMVKEAIAQMLVIQAIRFVPILLPIAQLLSIMLTLGRLYQDSEMVALTACGYGPGEIYRPLYMLGIPLMLLVLGVSMWVAPNAARLQAGLEARARQQAQASVFSPGSFRETANGLSVVYVESQDPVTGELRKVFIQSRAANGSVAITTGERGHQEVDETGNRYLILDHGGKRYEGQPGALEYRASRFEWLRARLEDTPVVENTKRESTPTVDLLGSRNRQDLAEFHSRLGGPVSVLLVALLGPLLARARPRENRYGRMIGAILVYAVYMNLLGIGRAWIDKGTVASWVGLWWVHALLVALAIGLWWRYFGVSGLRSLWRPIALQRT